MFNPEECDKLAETIRKISQSEQVLGKLMQLVSDQGHDHSPAGNTWEVNDRECDSDSDSGDGEGDSYRESESDSDR